MDRASILAFSKAAAEARQELFGETATTNGKSFQFTVQVGTALTLEPGGFEVDGTLRGLASADVGFELNQRVQLRSRIYKITDVRTNSGSHEVGLTLVPLNV